MFFWNSAAAVLDGRTACRRIALAPTPAQGHLHRPATFPMSNPPTASDLSLAAAKFRETFRRVGEEMSRLIVGQAEIVEGVLVAFFAGGHVLLEGVPGLGKTMLVRTLSDAVNLKFS